jgi:mono/diheme cytochrome c family protein
MKRFLKIAGLAAGVLLLLVAASVAGLYAWTGAAINKKTVVAAHAFTAPADSASAARGEHFLTAIAKCNDCHGDDLGGKEFINDPAVGVLYTSNLTRGRGGLGADYTDADWERAVRHGTARDGRRLLVMPSNEYQYISDEDLGAIVAYIRTMPAVDRVRPATKIGPVFRALYAAGQLPLFPADFITHADQPVPSVPLDSTVEYGKYIGEVGCSGCHGAGYGGGKIPGTPPELPAAANITPTGIGRYSFTDFDNILRTGTRPDGSKLHPFMPIQATKLMTDVEMVAIWKYLKTVPAKEFGTR